MSFSFGTNIRMTVFGGSHTAGIGCVLDGIPAGTAIDLDEVRRFMARRAPGGSATSTARSEADEFELLSGIQDGHATGGAIAAVIRNTNTRSQDYSGYLETPRPGHSDLAAILKYGEYHDIRGGGHFSGRLTAPLCFAGGLCLQLLQARGVKFAAHILSLGGVTDKPFDPLAPSDADAILTNALPVILPEAAAKMTEKILAAKADGDSLGGVIECAVTGLPAGVGEPMYDSVESVIAHAVFSVPAVKGLEFGAGFAAAGMRGSENNDSLFFDENGKLGAKTNNAGGILGGITTGMPVIFRAAVKPTPSVAVPQETVNMKTNTNTQITVGGRHDPSILPRAVPAITAAAAVAIADLMAAGRFL
ncbi:MAG: chorismate synthase [Oscillospiraceae bacterium]|jgi:chorismate synthase|nr:chorismate synthase [Oscillospiraceae bacterium]